MKIKSSVKGFTLLEMLVVVLIIGILAAIALPQYKKAIEKSKASQALSLIKSIDESIESYHLTTGQYPVNLSQIDITIPESFNKDENFINNGMTNGKSNKDWNISLERYPDESYVALYMVRISGKYSGAGFHISYEANGIKRTTFCFERKKSANYIFNSNLLQGTYCEKIIQGKFFSNSTYARFYTLN